jgi:hypothetical protein
MENTTTTMQQPIDHITEDFAQKVQIKVSSEKLLNALYWIWDAFERANMPFFLVNQTAKDATNDHDLTGDKVEIGVRRLEWVSGGRRILDSFIQPIAEDTTKAEYNHEGVPVIVHIYDDHDCIINTDSKIYRHELFKLPNPYSAFEQIYG